MKNEGVVFLLKSFRVFLKMSRWGNHEMAAIGFRLQWNSTKANFTPIHENFKCYEIPGVPRKSYRQSKNRSRISRSQIVSQWERVTPFPESGGLRRWGVRVWLRCGGFPAVRRRRVSMSWHPVARDVLSRDFPARPSTDNRADRP